MRLKKEEINAVKQAALNYFGNDAKVYIFGSRVSDAKKGGDIDIYIETGLSTDEYAKKKIPFKLELYKKIGEQKIDVVINNFTDRQYIYEVAKKEGVMI
ncbi:MAG: nucleotidyltransferase domain-containing protein [bacterium]